eukprot:snap_masked-scaffold712_size108441-processed-gene-0.9 protein:Tk06085 transcript:snap_masked-scaffold712_size108441-processed-gene-0.9-mRNA-1 annotation:"hypothetical protein BRAFLDRAFT_212201"
MNGKSFLQKFRTHWHTLPSLHRRFLGTSINRDKQVVQFEFTDGTKDDFPFVWLRDSCQSSKSFDASSFSRLTNLRDFAMDIQPVSCEHNSKGKFTITWEDGHVSPFSEEFLRNHSFQNEARASRRMRDQVELELWSDDFHQNFPRADFRRVMTCRKSFLAWLQDLSKFGFVLLQNVPLEEGHIKQIAERVAFEKLTHYGSGYTVIVRDTPSNIAYTPHTIGFHTDLTYYKYTPGVVLLHCIKQHEGRGGETQLADGFKAAHLLKARNPQAYDLLANTTLNFRDNGTDYIKFNKLNITRILSHDLTGRLERLNWSNFARHTELDLPLDDVRPFYDAMREYEDILHSNECHLKHKMKPGDMITVKNTRIVHGRTALEGKLTGRHLQCGYIDLDEVDSRIRVLQSEISD